MHRDDDAEIIAAARVGFLDEAADMLQQFEQALLVMETDPADAENLNAAFRAAHTIKGTAGLFGCDAVVLFTHEVETLLEGLRSGALPVTDAISAALLEGLDQMAALLDEVRSGRSSPAVAERSQVLGARLRQLYGASAVAATPDAPAPAGATPAAPAAGAGAWHLSLRFGPDALRNGLDPLAFIRYLGNLGAVTGCAVVADDLPALADLDAEACHLGFELGLHSTAGQDEIERVFEFAADDCSLHILPPDADGDAFEQLLDLRCQGDGAATEALLALWAGIGVGMGQLSQDTSAPPAEADAAEDEGTTATATASAANPATAVAVAEPAAVPATDRRTGRDRRAPAEARFVKVRADKLDHLIDLIGELVIAGSGAQMVANQEGSAGLPGGHPARQRPGAGHARRRAGAAHGAGGRDLQPLPARGARHQQAAGQGDRARRHRRRHRARQEHGRVDRRPADAPGAQQPGPRHRAARRAPGRRQARHRAAGPQRLPRRRQHRHRSQRRRPRPAPRPHPGQGHRARPDRPRARCPATPRSGS
jgi:two-component system chemotaxis sensor kinase CheA